MAAISCENRGMEFIKILTLIGKLAGFITSLHLLPMVSPEIGIIVFFIASLLKDTVNRVGDFLDDGKENQSWKV